jgi:hypothetical protein
MDVQNLESSVQSVRAVKLVGHRWQHLVLEVVSGIAVGCIAALLTTFMTQASAASLAVGLIGFVGPFLLGLVGGRAIRNEALAASVLTVGDIAYAVAFVLLTNLDGLRGLLW